ncbi:unnamed protein product [Cutaneotrichosporon oleaginosum]
MSFRALANGAPVMAQRAASSIKGPRRRQATAGGQAQQSTGAQAQASSPAAASPSAAANQASGQAGQSPSAAAAAGSSAARSAGSSASAGAASPAGSPSAAQNSAQSGAAQNGSTNSPAGGASGSSAASATTSRPTAGPPSNPGAFISSTVQGGSGGLSQPAIGALVGGIIGGLALVIVVFVIWRQCRGRGEKIAPPPPREVSYRPPTMVGNARRSMSMTMSSNHRVSSYSTLIGPRASGTYRQSYYSAYPVDSPNSSIQQDQSPRFPSNSIPSGSPSLTSSGGNTTPHRDGSTGSAPSSGPETTSAFQEHDGRPLHRIGNSADQLSPYDNIASTDGSESRTTGSNSRTSSPPPSVVGRLPQRSPSMGSLGGGLRYGHQRGAPHHRSISITLPRPLSQTSINALDSNVPTPTGVYYPRTGFTSNRSTPRTSIHGELGSVPMQSSPSGHRRGLSTSSRASDNRPDAAQVDNLRFEGREDIV